MLKPTVGLTPDLSPARARRNVVLPELSSPSSSSLASILLFPKMLSKSWSVCHPHNMKCLLHGEAVEFVCTNRACLRRDGWQVCPKCLSSHLPHAQSLCLRETMLQAMTDAGYKDSVLTLIEAFRMKRVQISVVLAECLDMVETTLAKLEHAVCKNDPLFLLPALIHSTSVDCRFDTNSLRIDFNPQQKLDQLNSHF
jgi:hypothetical protein